ncbi:hypothetical protein [Streptomyces bluensis]|uniref:SH3b domain-containing protein n=1 Tax=Streptomyces bluensis TaxID=33897 RepID=A0ABW6U9E3_9ACTN|nr:hypothetical protein GCM10010344_65290 [Streptomyces bluensis]
MSHPVHANADSGSGYRRAGLLGKRGSSVAVAALATVMIGASGVAAAGPAAAAPVKTASCTTYVATQTLNVRSQPSTFGDITGSLTQGDSVCGSRVVSTLKGGTYTACGATSSTWVTFGKAARYVAATCMRALKG